MVYIKDSIAKVILLPDGSVHIALNCRQSVYASPASLFSLIQNPYDFVQNGYIEFNRSTKDVFGKAKSLNEVVGLTLAVIYEDYTHDVYFRSIYKFLANVKSVKPINFMDYAKKTTFEDKGEYYISKFLMSANNDSQISIKNEMFISLEAEAAIAYEILNVSLSNIKYIYNNKNKEIEATTIQPVSSADATDKLGEGYIELNGKIYITLKNWAAVNKQNDKTVYNWFYLQEEKGEQIFQTAFRHGRSILISPNEPVPAGKGKNKTNNNKSKNVKKKSKKEKKVKTIKNTAAIKIGGMNMKEAQEYAKSKGMFSDRVCSFFSNKEEVDYFVDNNYVEVFWNNESFLITYVDFNYYSEKHQKYNYELVFTRQSPVVPKEEENKFHLHHIGQQELSVLAVIDSVSHQKNFSILHSTPSSEDVHNEFFTTKKISFWNIYYQKMKEVNFDYDKLLKKYAVILRKKDENQQKNE